jgi:hypothetical protein
VKPLSVLLSILTTGLIGCGQPEDRASELLKLSTDSLAPFAEALGQFDRNRAGFPRLPTNGTLKIETVNRQEWSREYPPPPYDVMLHFIEDPPGFQYAYCTVEFKMIDGRLRWIGEQHSYHGPTPYEADDVIVQEAVTITRDTVQIAVVGTNLAVTVFRYSGPNPRDLTSNDVVSILTQWGYSDAIANGQRSEVGRGKPVRPGL